MGSSSSPLLLPLLLVCYSLVLHNASSKTPLGLSDVDGRRPRTKIFHPSTGFCVLRSSLSDPLRLGPCSDSDSWSYTPQKILIVKGTYFCMQAAAPGKPVHLDIICDPSESQWLMLPESSDEQGKKTHLASKLSDGTTVCLDVGGSENDVVVSNPCRGLEGGAAGEQDSQWFKLVTGYNVNDDGSEF